MWEPVMRPAQRINMRWSGQMCWGDICLKRKKEELNNMKTRQGILHTTVLERTSVVSKGENGTKWSRRQRTWVLQAKETVCLLLQVQWRYWNTYMCVCVFIHMNILIYTEVLNEGISFKIRIRPFHSLEVMKRSDICLKRKTFNCCIENRV